MNDAVWELGKFIDQSGKSNKGTTGCRTILDFDCAMSTVEALQAGDFHNIEFRHQIFPLVLWILLDNLETQIRGVHILEFHDQPVFLFDGFAELSCKILLGSDRDDLAHAGLHSLPFLLFELESSRPTFVEAVVDLFVNDGDHMHSILDMSVLAFEAVGDTVEQVLAHWELRFGSIGQFLLAGHAGPQIENGHVHAFGKLLHSVDECPLADLLVGEIVRHHF